MSRGRWALGALGTAILLSMVLSSPASARSFSGSLVITGVGTPASNGSIAVTADIQAEEACDGAAPTYEYCGYWLMVTTVPAAQVCTPLVTGSSWVGTLYSSEDSAFAQAASASWHEWPAIYTGSKRACLYAETTGTEMLLAEAVYDVPAAAPVTPQSQTPAPAATQPVSVRPLAISRARAELVDVLSAQFDGFVRSALKRDCYRLGAVSIRCRVRWDYRRRWRYEGFVDIRTDPDDPDFLTSTPSIRRKRLRTVPTKVEPSHPTTPSRQPTTSRCNPNYSGVCLPLTGDIDCPEIAAHDFRVVGDDPFRLDGDGDGIACES
jgi:hypothetical protein